MIDEVGIAHRGATLHGEPANATHWSTRTLAEHLGMAPRPYAVHDATTA